jgi:hypothetical protein
MAMVLEMGEEVADLRLGERVGRLPVVPGELTDGSYVGLAGALGEAGELEVLQELLAKSGHGRFLSERGVSERASASEVRYPSECVSAQGHASQGLLTERVPYRVRGSGPNLPRSGFLEQQHAAGVWISH